jgi:hypothetical protein
MCLQCLENDFKSIIQQLHVDIDPEIEFPILAAAQRHD